MTSQGKIRKTYMRRLRKVRRGEGFHVEDRIEKFPDGGERRTRYILRDGKPMPAVKRKRLA